MPDTQKSFPIFGEIVFHQDHTDQECEKKIRDAFVDSKEKETVEKTVTNLKSSPLVWEACHDKHYLQQVIYAIQDNNKAFIAERLDFHQFYSEICGYELIDAYNKKYNEHKELKGGWTPDSEVEFVEFEMLIFYNVEHFLLTLQNNQDPHPKIMEEIKKKRPQPKSYENCKLDSEVFLQFPLLTQFALVQRIRDIFTESYNCYNQPQKKAECLKAALDIVQKITADDTFKFTWMFLANGTSEWKRENFWKVIVINNPNRNADFLKTLFYFISELLLRDKEFYADKGFHVFAHIVEDPIFQQSLDSQIIPILEKLMSMLPDERKDLGYNRLSSLSANFLKLVNLETVAFLKKQGQFDSKQLALIEKVLPVQCADDLELVALDLARNDFRKNLKKCLDLCAGVKNENANLLPPVKEVIKLGGLYRAAIDKKIAEVLQSTHSSSRKTL